MSEVRDHRRYAEAAKCRCGRHLAALCPATCLFIREPYEGGAVFALESLLQQFIAGPSEERLRNLGVASRKFLRAYGTPGTGFEGTLRWHVDVCPMIPEKIVAK